MLEDILNIQNAEDFGKVSGRLISVASWECLQNECCDEGVILYSSDAWSADKISRLTSKPDFVNDVVAALSGDGRSEKLLHWLQVLSVCNPGLRSSIDKFIRRAAL